MTTTHKTLKGKIDDAAQRLADDLAAGRSENLRRYLAVMSRFHRYSLANQMLIAAQSPTATKVAGFRAWQRLGRHVKKGSRAIYVFAPIKRRRRSESEDEREPAPTEEEQIVAFRPVAVFDVSQTRGKPLPEPARMGGDPGDLLGRLEAFAAARQITIERSSAIGTAEGVSTGGRVLIREGLAPAEQFSVTVHELAHELLHRGDQEPRPDHRVRETEAEAVAFVVCSAVGLEPGTACSDYIQVHQGDRQTLLASLCRVRRAAGAILEHLYATPSRKAA